MADKEQQLGNGYTRHNDTEAAAASHDARELRKKKRNKLILYITIFVIFQIAVITAFSLTVMKVKTPKFRVRQATVTSVDTTAGLRATLAPQFSVKNTNFGRYKYRLTTVEFFYGGAKIGETQVSNSKAGWLSTKKFQGPAVELNIPGSPELTAHVNAGSVPITSSANMTGKVELMFILKKNKGTNMNCTMNIPVSTSTITDISCK